MNSFWPYNVNPSTFVQQTMQPVAGAPPVMPKMTPAFHGPAHQALYEQLHGALQQQMAVPGLLAQMQANPALAQQIGGLLSATPPSPQVAPAQNAFAPGTPGPPGPQGTMANNRIYPVDYAAAQAAAKAAADAAATQTQAPVPDLNTFSFGGAGSSGDSSGDGGV